MKRLMMMTALLMAVTVKAQGPMILGDNHAMLRVKQGTKYLLLPVQTKWIISFLSKSGTDNC